MPNLSVFRRFIGRQPVRVEDAGLLPASRFRELARSLRHAVLGTIFRGRAFRIGARFGFTRPAQVYDLAHQPASLACARAKAARAVIRAA